MIETRGLHVEYRGKPALNGIDLRFGPEFTAVIGPSGAGKSSLLRSIVGMAPATRGEILMGDEVLARPGSVRRRRQQAAIGMVFQQFGLVRRLTALDNVLLGRLAHVSPLRGALGWMPRSDRLLAMHLLERVGLADHAWKRADQLSGGQQQRVGIARALAQRPRVILADEPISALDPRSSHEVMELLRDVQQQDGIAVVANLHDLHAVRQYAVRVVALNDGRVVFQGTPEELTPERVRELYGQRGAAAAASAPRGGRLLLPV